MESWRIVKDKLKHYSIEIAQRNIVLNSKETAQKIDRFSNLEDSKTQRIIHILITHKSQSTGSKEKKIIASTVNLPIKIWIHRITILFIGKIKSSKDKIAIHYKTRITVIS